MDKFIRVNKPTTASRPTLQLNTKSPAPQSPPVEPCPVPVVCKLENWDDVVSEQADNMDLALLSKEQVEAALRLFDLNPAYGPFVGVDRKARWERACEWGLNPPDVIRRLLELDHAVDKRDCGSLW